MKKIEKIYAFLADIGSGSGSGSGYGSGSGDGSGSGYGDGSGSGDGEVIKSYKGDAVFYVDNMPTIFDRIIGNAAHCRVIRSDDWQERKCYVVKGQGKCAHGDTLQEARESLVKKIMQSMSVEERIDEFCKLFNATDRYPAQTFFQWHNTLTGSCEMGRREFVRSHNISMEASYTVAEFISFCENDYGGDVIKQLKERYVC